MNLVSHAYVRVRERGLGMARDYDESWIMQSFWVVIKRGTGNEEMGNGETWK